MFKKLHKKGKIMKPYIFAINAISGGGKTTITRELQKKLPNSKALYFDDRNYDSDSGIEDICEWVENGADANLYDLKRLADDIDKFIEEKFDFIILDYPFGYKHSLIKSYLNFSIFIDTPLDIAMARRISREFDEKIFKDIMDVLDDMKNYLKRGRNAYLYGVESGKNNADFIVDGALSVEKIVDCIYQKIIKNIQQ
jgi:uridine kinase